MGLIRLAWQSALYRRYTLLLSLLSIALSVLLVLGVEKIREAARTSFEQSISGTDLIVGARGSSTQLLLYSVFRIGDATQNMDWESVEKLSRHPAVAWTIPLSLGDSHHGFPVLATNDNYLKYFHYGDHQPLRLSQGKWFNGIFEVVIGAEVAQKMGYHLGQSVVLSHGNSSELNLLSHQDKPFKIVGIFAPTGTAVDRTLHISLAAMEAIHLDWQAGMPVKGFHIPAEMVKKFDLTPKTVTATLIGLHNRIDVFRLQRQIDNYRKEPLQAVLPGVAIDQLWQMLGMIENALQLLSGLVLLASIAGLMTMMLATLNERKREMAILRAVGAKPRQILWLILVEMTLTMLVGSTVGILLLALVSYWLTPWIALHYGLMLPMTGIEIADFQRLAWLLGVALLAGLVPAYRAYRLSLIGSLSAH